MKWPLPAALGLCCVLALILRVPDLDQRPFHNDEAVNAIKFRALYEQGTYCYDPHEYHGPLLHYGTLILARLGGWSSFDATTEASFRWLSVLAGVSLIPLLWLTRDALGRAGTLGAALFTALSPSLTFFSRDYIHESVLVAAVFMAIGCLWRYRQRPGLAWAVLIGVAFAAMHTTKETFVFNVIAMGIAFGLVRLWSGCEASEDNPCLPGKLWQWGAAGCVWVCVSALLFSSFGTNAGGPLDSIRTYLFWSGRAGGESPHVQPFWFYAQRLLWQRSGFNLPWTELGMLALALVAAGAAVLRRGMAGMSIGFVRWLVIYTAALFVMYSVVPYKTPWSILSASHGMAVLAGVGLAVVWQSVWRPRWRIVLAGVSLLILGQLSWQAWALSHADVSARSNPWAYADTAPDIRNLVQRIDELAAIAPEGRDMHVQVICEEGDYWPLPYYLRDYKSVGWWSELPDAPLAPVLILSPGIKTKLADRKDYVVTGSYQMRYGVFRSCLVKKELWDAFLNRAASE